MAPLRGRALPAKIVFDLFRDMCDDICMETNLTKKAKYFAHGEHDRIKQVRKYTGEPYWVHVDAVAKTVAEHGGNEFEVAAAFLHLFMLPQWLRQVFI